jgi:signal transduction histidine kinase
MLNFSRRSDSGIVDQDVAALVRQALAMAEKDYDLKKKYDFRQIAVRLALSEALPAVPCIPSEIEQVLLNLLRNAAQAMSEAGTPHPAITVRTAREGAEALIEVEDNGPGIPDAQINRVFEPFYTTKKVGEGTGLGLSVSYFIVTTTHRGSLSVASEPGRGTRFSIRLPLERSQTRPAA